MPSIAQQWREATRKSYQKANQDFLALMSTMDFFYRKASSGDATQLRKRLEKEKDIQIHHFGNSQKITDKTFFHCLRHDTRSPWVKYGAGALGILGGFLRNSIALAIALPLQIGILSVLHVFTDSWETFQFMRKRATQWGQKDTQTPWAQCNAQTRWFARFVLSTPGALLGALITLPVAGFHRVQKTIAEHRDPSLQASTPPVTSAAAAPSPAESARVVTRHDASLLQSSFQDLQERFNPNRSNTAPAARLSAAPAPSKRKKVVWVPQKDRPKPAPSAPKDASQGKPSRAPLSATLSSAFWSGLRRLAARMETSRARENILNVESTAKPTAGNFKDDFQAGKKAR